MISRFLTFTFVLSLLAMAPNVADAGRHCGAEGCGGGGGGGKPDKGGDDETDPPPPPPPPEDDYTGLDMTDADYPAPAEGVGVDRATYGWMHGDVGLAFSYGYDGTGSTIINLDNHADGATYLGNLTGVQDTQTHGYWTFLQNKLVAPGATHVAVEQPDADIFGNPLPSAPITHYYTRDETTGAVVGLQVLSLSFGLLDPAGTNVKDPDYELGTGAWDSIVSEATAGNVVAVKAAGNTNGGAVDESFTIRTPRPVSYQDSLNLLLIGTDGGLFVGALDGNGTTANQASIASYSTIAGSDPVAQDMFLVVGVDSSIIELQGTSFAAPIVAGYAAILGDKFENSTPTQVVDQLLITARTDTIAGYSESIHGQGEADLSRALAPTSIPWSP